MPQAEVNGIGIHYELTGPPGAAIVMLSNSLGTDLGMWEPQLDVLNGHYRVLRYDTRGHGRSAAPPGPYRIDDLGRDAVALLDALRFERVHFVGLSLGGMTGQWLGVHHPERVASLTLCATACAVGPKETWDARIDAVAKGGTAAVADSVVERWFTEGFRGSNPAEVTRIKAMILSTPADGYAACAAAVRDLALCDQISSIAVPTLLFAGAGDPSTPPAKLEDVRDRIQHSELVVLEAAHLLNIEQAAAFNRKLLQFLDAQTGDVASVPALDRHLFEAGLENRKSVLGAAHVERTLANADEFNRPFQEIMTSYCWGAVWGRPGLPRKTRSLLNLAMLTALNRPEEFKLHVRAALGNGVTKDEIMEVLLQAMIYAGVPAANAAFRDAREVFKELETKSGP